MRRRRCENEIFQAKKREGREKRSSRFSLFLLEDSGS